jgi:hypothetical protein
VEWRRTTPSNLPNGSIPVPPVNEEETTRYEGNHQRSASKSEKAAPNNHHRSGDYLIQQKRRKEEGKEVIQRDSYQPESNAGRAKEPPA